MTGLGGHGPPGAGWFPVIAGYAPCEPKAAAFIDWAEAARGTCSGPPPVVKFSRDGAMGPDMIGRERMWKLVSTGTGMLAGLLARKLMRAGYTAIRRDKAAASPFDPTKARFSWPDAMLWAAAGGIGLGIAKVVSARVALFGWEQATGTAPPGIVEEPPVI